MIVPGSGLIIIMGRGKAVVLYPLKTATPSFFPLPVSGIIQAFAAQVRAAITGLRRSVRTIIPTMRGRCISIPPQWADTI